MINCFLGEILDLNYGKGLTESQRECGVINVYGSGGIIGKHNEALVNGPGIIIGRKGNVGSVYFEKGNFFPIDTVYYVSLKNENDDIRYIYYLLKTLKLHQLNSDAAVPGLNREAAHKVKIRAHNSEKQNRISTILGNYDDLIENNLRRIELLEKSAELLYKEWFVNLRFPGYEKTEIKNGIPEGWKQVQINEICEKINYGYTASADAEKIGPKYLRITDIVPDIINWDNVPYCEIPENKKENFLLQEGDIVVARTGATVGFAKRINKRNPEAVFASYLVRLRIKKEYSNIIAGTFIESEYYKNFIKSRVIGAAQPNANAKIITSANILLPVESISKQFDGILGIIINQKEVLSHQNLKLVQARDLLLPKLINGEIEV